MEQKIIGRWLHLYSMLRIGTGKGWPKVTRALTETIDSHQNIWKGWPAWGSLAKMRMNDLLTIHPNLFCPSKFSILH